MSAQPISSAHTRAAWALGLALFALTAAFSLSAQAQQTGTIVGTTEDPTGTPVAGVRVIVASDNLIGGAREDLSDDSGAFRFIELPPGTYEITAEAEGLVTYTQRGIKLGIGQTVALALIMEVPEEAPGQDEEIVVVVNANAPIINTRKVELGQNLSAEFLEEIPSGRTYQDAALITPGVTGGGNPVVHGGSLYSNQYLIDGINTTDPTTNTFNLNFNFDAIEDLQIITGGLSPEYGNATGGVINIVTKSGGNEFHADASLYYTGDALTLQGLDEEDRDFRNTQSNINLSGPIVKDRLWYFFSLEYDDSTSQLTDESPIAALQGVQHPARRYRSAYWLGKLTAAPNDNNRFTLLLQGDPTTIDNSDQDPSAAAETETHQDQGGILASLRWDGFFEPLVVKVQAGYKYSFLDIFPQEGVNSASPFSAGFFGFGRLSDRNTFGQVDGCLGSNELAITDSACTKDAQDDPNFGQGYHIDLDTGAATGGGISDVFIERTRWQFTSSVSYFVDQLLGSHEFKLGTDIAITNDTETARNPGGALIFFDTDLDGDGVADPFAARITSSDDNKLTTSNDGRVFAFFLLDNWNWDDRVFFQPGVRVEQATYEDYTGEAVIDFFVVSPRLSLSVDAFADGGTRVHAGFGQLYETGNLSLAKFVGKSLETRLAFFNPETGRYEEDVNSIQIQGGAAGTTIDKDNLEPQRTDEYQIGVEQALGEDLAVDLTYIHRDTTNIYEDDETNLIWNQAGDDIIGSRDGTGQQIYRLTQIDAATRTYDAVELSVNKRFVDRWLLSGSYVLSWYRGTTTDFVTGAYDNPRQNAYLDGYLPDDHRHTIKAQAVYRFDMGLSIGTQILHQTGAPFSKFFLNNFDGDFTNRRAPRGRDPRDDLNDPEDDRPLQLPDFTTLDLRIGYELRQISDLKVDILLDIFNVLNASTVTNVQQNATDDGSFGQPTDRQAPFQAQLGVRARY